MPWWCCNYALGWLFPGYSRSLLSVLFSVATVFQAEMLYLFLAKYQFSYSVRKAWSLFKSCAKRYAICLKNLVCFNRWLFSLTPNDDFVGTENDTAWELSYLWCELFKSWDDSWVKCLWLPWLRGSNPACVAEWGWEHHQQDEGSCAEVWDNCKAKLCLFVCWWIILAQPLALGWISRGWSSSFQGHGGLPCSIQKLLFRSCEWWL